MAVDEALVRRLTVEEGPPVLRLFGWEPPAVSFGYSQDPAREVDLEKCRRAGVDLVRRPTGGRAVLHAEELTYSVVCRQDDPQLGGPLEQTYRVIGECLVEGLRRFGVAATLERVSPRSGRPRGMGATAPCFSSIARWEVKCQGRKLIGSAQRRVGGVILQHGSLLIGDAHLQLLDLLLPMPADQQRRWRERLEQHSIHLGACMDRPIDSAALAACLAAGFEARLEVEMQPGFLSPAEEQCARELAGTQYGEEHWRRGRRDGGRIDAPRLEAAVLAAGEEP